MSEAIWRKEIHLRKPKVDKKVEAAAPKVEEPKKKRFRRGREPLPPFPTHLLEQQRARAEHPKGTVAMPVVPVEPVQRVERWTSPAPAAVPIFPLASSFEPEAQPSLLPDRAAPEPDPVAPEPAPEQPAEEAWTFTAPEPEPAPDPEPVWSWEPSAPQPEPDGQPPAPEPEPVWSWEPSAPQPEPDAQPPAREPEPVWSFAPSEREPEPAAEAPAPEPEPEPVWSFTAPTPAPTPEPEHAAEAPAPEPASDTAVEAPEPVAEAEPEPEPVPVPAAPVEAPEPAAEKVPLLKREISFKRKPKAAKPPKAKKAPKEKAPKAEKPDAEKTPLLKRELSLKRKPKAPKAERAPKAKRSGKGDHKVTRVVGLRIGSTQLAAAHIQNNGSHELVQLARTPLERGVVVAGEVRDADTLTRALKEFFSTNKLPRKDVRLGIASNRIGVRVLDVPAVDDPKAFENVIRFRAQELLPIPVTDAILDHVVLGDTQGEEGDVLRRVLLVFAHRELVNRFVDVCRGAGVRLSGIDLDAFALLRAIGTVDAAGEQAVVAVGIGHERTILAVSDGSVCDFTRVLEWGGSSVDVALARALNLTPSQAEPVKQMLDLDAEHAPDGLSAVQFEAAKSAVRAEIGALGRELVSSLRFYQSRADSLALGEVLLSGGAAQLRGLPEELNRLLGVPVRVVDPLMKLSLNKKIKMPDETGSLAIAVGLGMEV